MAQAQQDASSAATATPAQESLDDCIKLLKGNSDEQRLVGLLLATKFVSGNDIQAVHRVFEAIGFQFINRLLKTGMGKFKQEQSERSYLHLAISILAAFCRIQELASADEMIEKAPIFVEVLKTKQEAAVLMDSMECLLAIATASDKGFVVICQSRIFHATSVILQNSAPDAPEVTIALNLIRSLVTRISMDDKTTEYAEQLACVVPPLARHLSGQQSLLKFEVLDILRMLLMSLPTRLMVSRHHSTGSWPDDVRTGLGQILHSHVGPEHRYAALELAEEMVELLGASWLVGNISFPNTTVPTSSDRFLFLVVESLRVEVPIILGEIMRGATDQQLSNIRERHQSLATCYALLEHVINFISDEEVSTKLNEDSSQKIVTALDEIAGVILQRLEDAKDNGVNRGDELLSSVRLLGRYLAEVPSAHNARLSKLLGFMLSITTEGEQSPFYAVQFMIPALLQITMDVKGCEALVSSGGHKEVVTFVVASLTGQGESLLVEALDILVNVLQKKDILIHDLSYLDFVPAVPVSGEWAIKTNQNMIKALAACFCMGVLQMTEEGAVKNHLEVKDLEIVYCLVGECLQCYARGEAAEEEDLIDMIISECLACVSRYPSLMSSLRSCLASLPNNSSWPPNLRMLGNVL